MSPHIFQVKNTCDIWQVNYITTSSFLFSVASHSTITKSVRLCECVCVMSAPCRYFLPSCGKKSVNAHVLHFCLFVCHWSVNLYWVHLKLHGFIGVCLCINPKHLCCYSLCVCRSHTDGCTFTWLANNKGWQALFLCFCCDFLCKWEAAVGWGCHLWGSRNRCLLLLKSLKALQLLGMYTGPKCAQQPVWRTGDFDGGQNSLIAGLHAANLRCWFFCWNKGKVVTVRSAKQNRTHCSYFLLFTLKGMHFNRSLSLSNWKHLL